MRDLILYPFCKLSDLVLRKKLAPGVLVLMYHSISQSDSRLAVSLEEFERQMNYLHQIGYKTINPLELLKTKNYEKKVIITFDDGFKDNYLNALPILKKYDFSATIFISTDYIGSKSVFCKEKDRGFEMLNEAEIKELEKANWVIANHFASHQDLDKLEPAEIKEEISKSVKRLENIIDNKKTARIFSYPHSKHSESVIDEVKKEASIAFAGENVINCQNKYFISRVEVPGYVDFARFKCLLSPSYLYLRKMR
jgi:peptidoglycan/xylan/chitin deacetylase (PgdA/CDA1 family)